MWQQQLSMMIVACLILFDLGGGTVGGGRGGGSGFDSSLSLIHFPFCLPMITTTMMMEHWNDI